MREKINEDVSVVMYYSSRHQIFHPYLISWRNQDYFVGEIGYHHKVYKGRVAHHIFELADRDESIWMRLNFNTDSLHWVLEVVSDGCPS